MDSHGNMAYYHLSMNSRNQTKKILIISLFFPPSTMVGGKRLSFLSEILEKTYSDLHVLTLKEKYVSQKDHSLPFGGIIHRTGMYPPHPIKTSNIFMKIFNRVWCSYLCLVDSSSGWILPGLIKGLRIIKDEKIDLIISTGPPFSSMVIGLLLNYFTRVPLILDYRDPWSNFKSIHRKVLIERINDMLERLAIRRASALVFCSQMMRDDFIKSLGKFTKATLHVVHNGFHNKDTIEPLSLGRGRKNMVYAGSFYGQRKIKLLVAPLLQLSDEGSITKDSFCFHIFGKLKDDDREVIKEYDLQDIIIEHSPIPYKQIIKYLKGADILFLPSGSDVSQCIPFKFYDYLSVERPMLAVAPQRSAVAELMNKIDCGRLALINSQESILTNLRAILFENKEYTYSGAQQYTWDESARKYIQIIDNIEGASPEKSL